MWFVAKDKWFRIITLLVLAFLPVFAGAASTTVTANVCRSIIDPTTLTSATSSPTTSVTADIAGTAEPNAAVDITKNGNSVATVLADGTGNFGVTIGLDIGDNHLVAIASDACGHQATSAEIVITRNPVPPPAPAIFQPQPGDVVSTERLLVSGQTESLATVTIYLEGQTVATLVADDSGAFATTIPLVTGSNHLQVSSANSAGTGPLSSIITVTRTATVSPGVPLVGLDDLATPVIVSPSGPVSTSATSILLAIQAPADSIVEVYRGDALQYTLKADSSGVVRLEAAQVLGDNIWTVRANKSGTRTPRSRPVTVTRLPTPLAPPTIAIPSGSVTLTQPWAEITGTSEPGTTLKLYSGRRPIARLVINETGTFSLRIPVRPGTNVVYAESIRGEVSRRSGVLVLSYTTPGLAGGISQRLLTAGQVILGSVLGTAIFVAQATSDLVNRLITTPALTVLVLGLALLTLTFTQGLVGFELLLMLLPFIRWWWRLVEQPSMPGHVIVAVTDSVTGRPLPLVLATVNGPRGYTVISDFAGHLHLPSSLAAAKLKLGRPGYRPLGITGADHITLEPIPAAASLRGLLIDALLGLTAWVLLVLASLTSFALAFTRPSLLASALAIAFAAILVINVMLLAFRPRIKWGHIVDADTGHSMSDVTIDLTSAGGHHASHYLTQADGRYTLHAPVGEYEVEVSAPGYQRHREHVSVRWREAYLGFNLKLRHDQ